MYFVFSIYVELIFETLCAKQFNDQLSTAKRRVLFFKPVTEINTNPNTGIH